VTTLEDYRDRFACLAMNRDAAGVLEVRLHSSGGSFDLDAPAMVKPQTELADAFAAIAGDPDNRVVLFTGTGESFSGPRKAPDRFLIGDTTTWERVRREGVRLLTNFLDIDALVVTCINGPALRHAELALLGDIVLADTRAVVQDSAHFPNRTVPGDGINIVLPLLMGINRAKYMLLTGQTLDAAELKSMGVVAEVLPPDRLMARGRELAAELARNNPLTIRYTKLLLRRTIRKEVQEMLEHSLSMEAFAAVDESMARRTSRS
jgi:enoyl-CoA hydratase/carnithine racemase